MPLYCERLDGWTSIADTFVSFFGNLPGAFWLDREHHPAERYSIIGAGQPAAGLEFEEAIDNLDLPFSFRPGYVGVIHYPQNAGEIEGSSLLAVDRAFVYGHDDRSMHFIGNFPDRQAFDHWYHAALLRLALIGGESASYELNNPAATAAELVPEDSRGDYLKKISECQEHIAAGDVYQLCLTTRLRGEIVGDPLSYFLRMRKQHPAPYSSFVRLDGATYVSISPELFISVSGKHVISSPIKGTRPRSADEAEDLQLMNQLGADAKERAENLMIVDLIRNDLTICCDPASVSVDSLLAVRSYSTVHQLVSDVSGELREGQRGMDALRALLPGGSMTGAPKIRAMEIISQIESSPRAGYSGAIGWIAHNQDMELAMVIRTAVFAGSEVSIGIGGGITSDSRLESEHEEIRLKAMALADVLGAKVRW
jgi:para-aminobenzoate synthetase component 1